MIQLVKKYTAFSFISAGLVALLTACANIASPSGGPYDLEPPKVVSTSPAFNATNVKYAKIVIDFDENVVVEKPTEKVIITPPQKSFPIINAANKRVTIELKDSLIENTTYTIDFTDAIVDNNEKNVLENFSFSFSTGDHVDTLQVAGKVLVAENLEPVKGIYVGLHSNLSDTAFTKVKFLRISRTNDAGFFTIRGVAPGVYKIYALDDVNRNYMYDDPSEMIAFQEATIEPIVEKAFRSDTIFLDPLHRKIDTIKTVEYGRFLPNDVVLRAFRSDFRRQYLAKYERLPNRLMIYFGAPTEMPEMEPLNFAKTEDWYMLEKSARNDTLTYWIKDPAIGKMDTISLKLAYMKTDSLNQLVPATDTLTFFDRSRKPVVNNNNKKKDKEENKEKVTFLEIKNNLSSSWNPLKDIWLEFSEPILDSLSDKIKLQSVKDSVYKDITFQLIVDSLNPRKVIVRNRWQYGSEYRISVDSATIHSIYGLWNNKLEQNFKVKNRDQYSQLAINIHGGGVDTVPSFVELLDKSDKPLRKAKVEDNVALFRDLEPGTYYARIILDKNNNGVWDTGDYSKLLQPEMVYYYEKYFELKANWEHEENWTINPENIIKQKPLEITKNKPQEKESKRKQLEKQEQQNQNAKSNKQPGTTPTDYNNVTNPGTLLY